MPHSRPVRSLPPQPVHCLPVRCSAPSLVPSFFASRGSVGSMSDPVVRIVFFGGLGEIGRNCLCLEVDDRILLVDCGLMFPDENMPGVDLVLPDFSYVRDNAHRVDGVFLTHAHEDHAGGLAFLPREMPVTI